MNIITSYNLDEVFNKIKIKKPIKFNNKLILNLYDEYQEYLLFQTPTMYLPRDYIHDEKTIKLLDLCEYNDTKFLNFMILLFKKILAKIENFDKKLFLNKNYHSNIIQNTSNLEQKMLRLKDIYLSQINVYDINNNLINIEKIIKESKVKCIIMIRSVWINEDKYGFKLNLLQMQYKDFLNNVNLLKKSSNNDEVWTTINVEPDLDKIPPPPPPPPPPPSHNNTNLKDIINNNKEKRKQNEKNKNNNKEPSMSDVLNQLKTGEFKLRKTNNKKSGIPKNNETNLMCEMEEVLKRRMSLIDGQ